jgi:hypothetical protein
MGMGGDGAGRAHADFRGRDRDDDSDRLSRLSRLRSETLSSLTHLPFSIALTEREQLGARLRAARARSRKRAGPGERGLGSRGWPRP